MSLWYKNDRDCHSAHSMISIGNKVNSKNLMSDEKQESGRDSVKNNLVQNVTSMNNIENLSSKSYIKATHHIFI